MASSTLHRFLLLLTLTAAATSTLAEPAWEREIADVRNWIETKFTDGVHAFENELSASRLEVFASELGVSSPQAMEGVGAAQMLETLGKEALSEVVTLGEGRSEEAGNEGSRREGLLVESPVNLRPAGENADKDLGHYAGYFRLNRTHDARMFYFFFESRGNKSTDPVVLWMTGGPGCSSELAVFAENGPFKIDNETLELSWNPYGWDKVSNLVYVDQPIGTGFSYSHDPRDIVHTEKGVSEDMYDFLLAFYEAHPEYKDHDFFITGESYAGHYVPAVAAKVHAMNKAKQGPHFNLKGIAIGNGLTQPDIQYGAYADFAYQNHLISKITYEGLRIKYPVCAMAIHACGTKGSISCIAALYICQTIVVRILAEANNINVYDIRKKCDFAPLCYDFSYLDRFLNQPAVKKELGVEDRYWVACSPTIQTAMLADIMRNLEPKIPALLEDGIRFLNYAGESDFICNWVGNSRWVAVMEWSGQEAYNKAPWVNFTVDGEFAGNFTGTDVLGFLKVKDAGHLVPMDQPKNALEMLRRFIRGEKMAGEVAQPLNYVI
eukprot:TRINITY_DN577_c0_g1_i1.p1 TRINITY_DN577_c0_g1~~TRINITY_DN577_c0_g1_i1.p1  ORF type:complete len:590 (+),score=177.93 TRINITY_DN577_c0_g1_i1:122-1771(+)